MADDKRPLKVFLCHASADKPKVRELYRYLKKRSIQPWLDAEDLLPGQNWQVEIPKALECSDAIIICLSKGSVDKEGYVQKEIKFALDRALEMPEGRIFLIPARLEECSVPRSLSSYHWVDLFAKNGREKLMGSLKVRADELGCSDFKTLQANEKLKFHPESEFKQPKNNVNQPPVAEKPTVIPLALELLSQKDEIKPDSAEFKPGRTKIKIRLKATDLKNVLVFLQSRLQSIQPRVKAYAKTLENYTDGIKREATYTHNLVTPYSQKNILILPCDYHIAVFPGKADITATEVVHMDRYDALIFTGWETLTVFLELDYDRNWQELVDSLIKELYEYFGRYDDEGVSSITSIPPVMPEPPQNISILVNGNMQGNLVIGSENSVQLQPVTPTSEKNEPQKLISLAPVELKDPPKAPRKLKPKYIVAIIGAGATILAALIGILPQFIKPSSLPTATSTIVLYTGLSPTPSFTSLPSNISSVITPVATNVFTPTPLPTLFYDTDPRGNKIEMRLVQAGEFIMGSKVREDEQPSHKVYLDSFYMDVYEVTNGLYKECMKAGRCSKQDFPMSGNRSDYSNNPQYDNFPVVWMHYSNAYEYCSWRGARLPTEAEWEKAARGTDGRTYPWGEGISCSLANYIGCVGDTMPVGSYESGKSPYGMYDMAGNVWEWTSSWFEAYPGNTISNPFYGTKYHVQRGGAYSFPGVNARSSERFKSSDPDGDRLDAFGFRCAHSVP